jgi:aspartyl-tRNA(Asn)/glutamyl-tRNA(Gln) amidotransferase subunit A
VKKIIAVVELFAIHAPDLRERPELFGAGLRYRVIGGSLIRGEDYIRALQARTDLARTMRGVFAGLDLILLPTTEPAGRLERTHPSGLFTHNSFTTAFNVSGNPALSLCSGYAEDSMPMSLQIVGSLFGDATVLRAGHAYEAATAWRNRRPSLC